MLKLIISLYKLFLYISGILLTIVKKLVDVLLTIISFLMTTILVMVTLFLLYSFDLKMVLLQKRIVKN